MKKWALVFFQAVVSLLLISSVSYSAPNINDGIMDWDNDTNDDWASYNKTVFEGNSNFDASTDLYNVTVEEGNYIGDSRHYDLEELGLAIVGDTMYIGYQGDLSAFQGYNGVDIGDFMFNFDGTGDGYKKFSDNTDADDFALDFSINTDGSVNMALLTADTFKMKMPTNGNFGKGWEVNQDGSTNLIRDDLVRGTEFNAKYTWWDGAGEDDGYRNGLYTLEAEITLTDELKTLFAQHDSVSMYLQESCGNDFLAARSDIPGGPGGGAGAVPEPGTMVLFGIGLLGMGAVGRRRQIKDSRS